MKSSDTIVPSYAGAAALALSAAACVGGQQHVATDTDEGPGTMAPAVVEATAVLEPKSGSSMSGTGTFTVEGDNVHFTVEVKDMPPGEHAVHIHEHADCAAHDAESAGGHWNPTNKAHGKWGVDPFHLGDIGNITVGADGTGRLTLTTNLWTVGTGKANDLTGHALMVHADPDDFTSQPSGNAGARVGCGAIVRK